MNRITLDINECENCGKSYQVSWGPDTPAQQSINCPHCGWAWGSVWLNYHGKWADDTEQTGAQNGPKA